jgi:hypothetical protein
MHNKNGINLTHCFIFIFNKIIEFKINDKIWNMNDKQKKNFNLIFIYLPFKN